MNVEPGYKQTDIGIIPENWDVKELQEVADIIMGQSPLGSSYNNSGKGIALINGPTEFREKYPVKIQWTTQPTKLCKSEDILLCFRGSSTGRINISNDAYCIGRGVAAIRAKANYDNSFLEFQTYNIAKSILLLTSGSTFPNIDAKSLKRISLALPSTKGEQIAIAKVLRDSDALIQSLKKLIFKKRSVKNGTAQLLLTGKERLQGFTYEWQLKPLSDIAKIEKGQQMNKSRLFENETYPVINGGIEPSGYTDKWNTTGYTITISEGGNSCGYVNFIRTKFWSGGHCYVLKNVISNVDKLYLFHVLKFYEKAIMDLRVGSGLPNIQKKNLNKFSIKLPLIEEQEAIREVLTDMDNEIAVLESKLKKYRIIKQGMIQNLLTGKIRLA